MVAYYDRLYTLFKRSRNRRGLTQQEVSDLIGVSQAHYSAVEKGNKPANTKIISDICRVHKCAFWIGSQGCAFLPAKEARRLLKLYADVVGKPKGIKEPISVVTLHVLALHNDCAFLLWKNGVTMVEKMLAHKLMKRLGSKPARKRMVQPEKREVE